MIANILSVAGGVALILILVVSAVLGAYFLSGAFYQQEDDLPIDNCFYDEDTRPQSEGEESQ